MIVTSLELLDFRKFKKRAFNFSPAVNIIIGPNAIGKTNILESLFLAATGKSFRAEESSEMISFEKEVSRTRCQIENSAGQKTDLEILLTRGMVLGVKTPLKKYAINGVGKHMLDFVGNLKVVLFWPQDMELVTDSPSLRRRYLDYVLMQVDREYRRTLHSYEQGVRQRNKVLEAVRDQGAHRHQLIFWDQLLIRSGEYITRKREEYIDYINRLETRNSRLAGGQAKLEENMKYELVYDKSIISTDRLDKYKEEEVAAANTLVGPHRDDFEFRIQNSEFRMTKDTSEESRNLSRFGSRGEQRLGVLWLKLRELAYVEEITGEKPVLLLDDIFSELDHQHRQIIFDMIGTQQTLMTTIDIHLLEDAKIKDAKMIELS